MINLIAAITYFPREDEFIIAVNGELPHTSPEDMDRFKKLTTGGVVIMGRKTYEAIGFKPLPDRTNIVLSRDPMFNLSNSISLRSLGRALEIAPKYSSDIWIIGGGQVYEEAIAKDIPDRLYISEMKGHFEGKATEIVTFPRVNMGNYKALYIEQFEDHVLKILSKESLDVL